MPENKQISLGEAITRIGDGAHIAIGGSQLRRHPIAAVHELVRQGKKDLTVYGLGNTVDFDLLVGAGCVTEAHTSSVDLGEAGQTRNLERAMENGKIRFVEHSRNSAISRFRAGAFDISFIPSKMAPSSDASADNEYSSTVECPFTGEPYVALRAFAPDFALIHAHWADRLGNIALDHRYPMDDEADALIARSAKLVIVTVEQVVSEETFAEDSVQTLLPKELVDLVIETPYGAHPTSCDSVYDHDADHLQFYDEVTRTTDGAARYLKEHVFETKSWTVYLDCIGLSRLMELTRKRGVV
jgi:glutaconate CoA-transferase subunit A